MSISSDTRSSFNLFLVSFVALFVEVTLIRWLGTEVRVFAYFQNLALIASFLGFGLGCFRAHYPKYLLLSVSALMILLVSVQLPSEAWQTFLGMHASFLSFSPDAVLWGAGWEMLRSTYPTWELLLASALSVGMVAIFLLLLVGVMVPFGQWVGFYLAEAKNPVAAYSINLLGSVLGVWAPMALAALWLPPIYWFGAMFILMLLLPYSSRRERLIGVGCMVVALLFLTSVGAHTDAIRTQWSPYQKLEVIDRGDEQYTVLVNNTGYMSIANMTPEYLAAHLEPTHAAGDINSYDTLFRFAERLERVLIVGAGAGNDAAAALRNGAGSIDAVEIDPVIYSFGRDLHPEHPYQSPRVRVIIDDARAFFRHAQDKYDVIVFGLLDSHTQFSDHSSVRIDNYVYTEEAFHEAKRLLKPGGTLIVKFEVREPWMWLGERLSVMLGQTFGRPPLSFYAPSQLALVSASVFITSESPDLWERAAASPLAEILAAHPSSFPLSEERNVQVTTDDWPYIYNQNHSIPRTFLVVSAILIAIAVLLVRRSFHLRESATWLFFFLGAGFLLMETQMISRLALYFGTTWIVNSVALTGILLVLVLANFYVTRVQPKKLELYYIFLFLCLTVIYLFPWQSLPYSARTVGILLASAYAVTLFFAGIIFTESFRNTVNKSGAFGANILGSVAGGLAQNLSFIFGMKALLIFAAIFYTGAVLMRRRY